MRYLVIVEETATGFSGYAPDVPGCIATGTTRAEVEDAMARALGLHVEELRAEGFPVPVALSLATYVDVLV
jgi:predicted RNase H-like HicB family nuclease